MLTDEEDVVLDIFGGSNTTGYTAEALKRKWITFEISREYLTSSAFRFLEGQSAETVKRVLEELNHTHSDYFIGETHCAIDPAKTPMTPDESHAQLALFVAGAEAK